MLIEEVLEECGFLFEPDHLEKLSTREFEPTMYKTNEALRVGLMNHIFDEGQTIKIGNKERFIGWIGEEQQFRMVPKEILESIELVYQTNVHNLSIVKNRKDWVEQNVYSKDPEIIKCLENIEEGYNLKLKFSGLENCPKIVQGLIKYYKIIQEGLIKSECVDYLAFMLAEKITNKKTGVI